MKVENLIPGDVYWISLEEMKQKKLADGMDKMLSFFLDENISEYFRYKENGQRFDVLK